MWSRRRQTVHVVGELPGPCRCLRRDGADLDRHRRAGRRARTLRHPSPRVSPTRNDSIAFGQDADTRQLLAESGRDELFDLLNGDDIWHYGIHVASGERVASFTSGSVSSQRPTRTTGSGPAMSSPTAGMDPCTRSSPADALAWRSSSSATKSTGRLTLPGIRPLSELADRGRVPGLPRAGRRGPSVRRRCRARPSAPLSRPVDFSGLTAGNRFCVLPLEGWDADLDGRPTASTRERWRRMGAGGAKLIWAESAAVRPDGRSTPSQLLVADDTVSDLAALRVTAVEEHERVHGDVSDLVVGLQLTHSGRMSHPAPTGIAAPVAVRRHPHMDTHRGSAAGAASTSPTTSSMRSPTTSCMPP